MQIIATLGELGQTGAILTPIEFPLLRNGAAWDLTGYDAIEIEIWDQRTRDEHASPGTIAFVDPRVEGVVRWTPAQDFASGAYEGRVKVSPPGSSALEPSGLFRFSIAGAPV